MKRFFALLILLASILFQYSIMRSELQYDIPVLLDKKEEVIPASASPPKLRLYGKYTGLMDAGSGRLLYGREAGSEAAMASTTKIMTCILALENGDRKKDVLKASGKAASMPRVHLGMRINETFLLNDLLYSLMLTSHNDTAVAIAEHIGGSVKGFAALMNQKAKKIGMTNTNFVTPNGLDAPGHQSTARDMCLLGSYALKNNEFRSIIQTKSHKFKSISSKRSFIVSNKDAFLSIYKGSLGIKTGFTSKAGYCFVGAAKKDNRRTLVSATLASGWPPSKNYKWQDTKALMDYGFKHYKNKTLPSKDLSKLKIPVVKGVKNTVSVQNIDSPVLMLSDFDHIHVSYQLTSRLKAPLQKTTPIGKIIYTINNDKFLTLPIYPSEDIRKTNFFDYCRLVFNKFCI